MIRLVSRRWKEERRTCVGNLLLDWDAAAVKSEEGFKRNEALRLRSQEGNGKNFPERSGVPHPKRRVTLFQDLGPDFMQDAEPHAR